MADFFLGLDSTDSLLGGCTTHVAALIVEELLNLGAEFVDYPHLIRLNPNIPFKTRGNGAVSLSFRFDESIQHRLFSAVEGIVSAQAALGDINCDPGLVFLKDRIPEQVQNFAKRCLHELVALDEAEELLQEHAVYTHRWKLGRGLIGALAAVGLTLPHDYIFEFIAYRQRENFGKQRLIDPASVREMDAATKLHTINNLDEETGRILITPRGPDPVLLGIRGESPEDVLHAFAMLRIAEEVERWIIFRSNECTDSHLQPVDSISQLEAYSSAIIKGTISERPQVTQGGHVFVEMRDATGTLTLAAYEPTGRFREAVRSLVPGDEVVASGGVKPGDDRRGLTLNLESMEPTTILRLVKGNPLCPACGIRMESMGRQKGHRCRRCQRRSEGAIIATYPLERSLLEGRKYQPPPRAHRHLTKPLSRSCPLGRPLLSIRGEWCSFYSTPMKSLRSSS